MIDIENARKEFINYTSKFDTKDFNIQRKIGHSIRVMNISQRLAESLNLEKEEIDLATLIGLLHDIGRFEQYTRYGTYNDLKSIDHGEFGVGILEENNYMRKYIEDDKYDKIIKKAVKNHNKLYIEDGLNDIEVLFANIIRDTDKIDILYEGTEIFWNKEKSKIEQEKITKEVEESVNTNCLVKNEFVNTTLDNIIRIISFIYDINFKESLEIIKIEDYINKIINRFNFEGTTKEKMEKIRKKANEYIELETK